MKESHDIHLSIPTQPDGVTCGPSCLHAIYQYYSDTLSLNQTILELDYLENQGTLAVFLASHALSKGYHATLHSFNLEIIDPTWFYVKGVLRDPGALLLDKLKLQVKYARTLQIKQLSEAYIKFIELGGKLYLGDLQFNLLKGYLDQNIPIISGVSSTYLYKSMRDYTDEKKEVVFDEWQGEPSGHFIILKGYDSISHMLNVADPYIPHNLSIHNYYSVNFIHWLHACLLGVTTNDAELLVITKD